MVLLALAKRRAVFVFPKIIMTSLLQVDDYDVTLIVVACATVPIIIGSLCLMLVRRYLMEEEIMTIIDWS